MKLILATLLFISQIMAGCGQKGPLRLPDAPAVSPAIPTAPPK